MGDDEPSDVPSDGRRGQTRTRCSSCDAVIDTGDWHPVTTERDAAGEVHLRSFCSEECRNAWLDESDATSSDDQAVGSADGSDSDATD